MISTRPRRTTIARELWGSQLGKKYVMAITGVVLFGYVVAHMVGNLKAFIGPDDLNHYAEWLRELGEPALPRTVTLWLMRGVLLGSVFLHIVAAAQLTIQNRKARPVAYSRSDYIAANYASRTMRWSGVILALFVVYHLAHMTWGTVHPDFVRGDVYGNVVVAFQSRAVVLLYIVSMGALSLHMYHGLWSMFQSLGWSNPRFQLLRTRFAQAFAAIVPIGFVAVPLGVLAGVLR